MILFSFSIARSPVCYATVFKILTGCCPFSVIYLLSKCLFVKLNAKSRLCGNIYVSVLYNERLSDISNSKVALIGISGMLLNKEIILLKLLKKLNLQDFLKLEKFVQEI